MAARDETVNSNELFLQLVRQQEDLLVRVSLRLCEGNRDRAEECVQQAIVNAYQAFVADRFQDLQNFKPWILRILTNVYLQECRRQSRTVNVPDFEAMCGSLAAPADEHSQALSPEIASALFQLKPDHRMCLLLIDVDDLDYAQAASILGIPVGTVRSRLARGRLKMAEIMATKTKEADSE